jgi:hypothetical protein
MAKSISFASVLKVPAELSPLRYAPSPVAVAADPAVAAFAPAPFESSFFSTLAGNSIFDAESVSHQLPIVGKREVPPEF